MHTQSVFVFILFCLFCVNLHAVDCHTEPKWWTKRYREGTFSPSLEKTVFIIGEASGSDSNDTEIKARDDAYVKASEYLGASHVVINKEVNSEHNFDSFTRYTETDCVKSQNKINEPPYTVYYLIQLVLHPTYSDQAEKVTTKYPDSVLLPLSFVPGGAQFYKQQYLRGSLFLGGEVLLIGGIAASFGMKSHYKSRIGSTHNSGEKRSYADKSDAAGYAGWAFVGAAVALYIWNILDGVFASGEPALFADGKKIAFAPVATPSSVGLAMNLNF